MGLSLKLCLIMSLAEEGPACMLPALLVASKTWAPREVSGRQGLKCQERGLCCQTVGFKSRLAVGTATHGVSVCSSVNGADGIK